MNVSLAKLNVAVDPNLLPFVKAVCQNNARSLLATATLTDNSTGVAGSNLSAVPTQSSKVAASGANLSHRTNFNTAISGIHDALTVLATYINTNLLAKLGVTQITLNGGNVAVAGTIPAITKALAAVDGSAGNGMLRSEANAAVLRARNNLATIVKAYNIAATAVGAPTLSDATGGSASDTLSLGALVQSNTAVAAGAVATSDLASDASVDSSLNALANNVATIAAKITANVLNNTVLSAKVPVVLIP